MVVINADTGISAVQNNAVDPTTDVVKNIPCFSAHQLVAQSVSANTATILNFDTKKFDTTSAFSTSTDRFTPQVAGYYNVNASVGFNLNGGVAIYIYKNGSIIREAYNVVNGAHKVNVNHIVYMNGTTDYLQAGCHTTIAGSTDVGSTFQAHLIVGA